MKRRKVCVIGNRSFPLTPEIGSEVVDILRTYPPQTTFLTRGSDGFDTFILRACEVIELPVIPYPAAGGSTNFDRDVQIVKDADEVLVFLDPATLDDENTGTAHVLSKALDQRKKVAAYSVSHNHLVYVGSDT